MSTVVDFTEHTGIGEVYEQIQRFLRMHKQSSKNTYLAYERDIAEFFFQTRGKALALLLESDLVFTIDEFEDYQFYLLKGLNLSVGTINRKIAAISECFRHLHSRKTVEDISFINIKRLKDNPNSHDHLTTEEVNRVADFVENDSGGNEFTNKVKKHLILFSFDTCSRLTECLNLTWDDLMISGDRVRVKTVQKGNRTIIRSISLSHYKELLDIKRDDTNKVFSISESTVSRMMDDIKEFLGVGESRKITFHSFRKAGAQFLWEETRDINLVSKWLGHSSIATTERYINKEEVYDVLGGYSSQLEVDGDLYKQASHENLIQAISNLGIDKQTYINSQLKEILGI